MGHGGIVILCILGLAGAAGAQLRMNYYSRSCPQAEAIVKDFIQKHIPNAPSLAAPLLRMQFHDCFVRGCDGSVLLDATPTNGNQTEKLGTPNVSLRGFDFIDRLKSLLENACRGVVSCADVVALAARDAISVTGGPSWAVPTGRFDGRVSNNTEATNQIPAPTANFSTLQTLFGNVGLNLSDLVILSGAHTVGLSHCSSFSRRLYNFSGAGDQDPAMDSEYVDNLRRFRCRSAADNTTRVEMDPGSRGTFDLSYYRLVLKRRGLFQSDAALRSNAATLGFINQLLRGTTGDFFAAFSRAMEKMGRIGIKTAANGEIRRQCRRVN